MWESTKCRPFIATEEGQEAGFSFMSYMITLAMMAPVISCSMGVYCSQFLLLLFLSLPLSLPLSLSPPLFTYSFSLALSFLEAFNTIDIILKTNIINGQSESSSTANKRFGKK